MDPIQLRQERSNLVTQARAIHAITTGATARELTDTERTTFGQLISRAEEITGLLEDKAETADLRDAFNRMPTTRAARADVGDAYSVRALEPAPAFRSLKPTEKIASLPLPVEERSKAHEWEGLSLGRIVRGIATGRWEGAERERRTMSSTLSAGGYLVPTPLADDVIDLARGMAVVFGLGARTVPMDSKTLSMAKVTADPTAQWLAENAAATPSDLTFGNVLFTAHKLVLLCKMSVEVFEDAQNIDEVVTNTIAQKLALELDRVALNGSGSGAEPTGILQTSGINSVTSGGYAAVAWSHIVQMESELATDNTLRGRLGYVTDGNTLKYLKTTQKASNTGLFFMDPDGKMNGYPVAITNQLPTTGSTHRIIFGNWEDLLIGMRRELVLEVSREASDSSSSAFTNVQVWVRGYLRADVQVALPQSFCAITDL